MKYERYIYVLISSLLLASCCWTRERVTYDVTRGMISIDNIGSKYLWIPIQEDMPPLEMEINLPEYEKGSVWVRLAQSRTDYYSVLNLDSSNGESVDIVVKDSLRMEYLLSNMHFEDRLPELNENASLIHFVPRMGWMNDPNGLVYHDGEYHMFFQKNPLDAKWGNMTWGHAVSCDLIHWTELAPVLYPDHLGDMFSGSAVIDKSNTSGFGANSMVAVYTAAGASQMQCVAYSNDNGRSFTKYELNPVLTSSNPDFRDPKVFWYEPLEKWIMVLAAGNAVEFYASADLKNWDFESRWGEDYGCHDGVWECPDLFPLGLDGEIIWVLLCSVTSPENKGSIVQYFLGQFDGHEFKCIQADNKMRLVNYGRDFYAAVTWSNPPGNRRIAVPWFNNWQYAERIPQRGRRGQMGIPIELTLKRNSDGHIFLLSEPVKELAESVADSIVLEDIQVLKCYNLKNTIDSGNGYSIDCDLSGVSAQIVGMKLFNDHGEYVDLYLDSLQEVLAIDRTRSGNVDFSGEFPSVSEIPICPEKREISIKLIVSPNSIECFTPYGSSSDLVFPKEPYNRMSIYTIGGDAHVEKISITKYK